MNSGDGGLVLRTLVGANVQFVVVGELDGAGALRLVVSRHPTNLEALGRALDELGSSLRAEADPAPGFHRLGDPVGTVAVRTAGGDVDLVFGGTRRSLYAETLEQAQERDVGGTTVQWSEEPAAGAPAARPTGRSLGRRLLSVADELAQLIERPDRPTALRETDGASGSGPSGDRPPPEDNGTAGGAESKGPPRTDA